MNQATNWTRFWQLGDSPSCLPHAEKTRRRIFNHWDDVASDLAKDAHVLDLGCGSGVLAEHLVAKRDDISVTGIDIAEIEPSKADRVTLMSGVDMADLPLDDASVDTAVSLFGVEYGDPEKFAPQLARVIKPGGTFSFVIHHADSPVVTANRSRGEMLSKLCDEKIGKSLIDQDRDGLVRQMFDLRLSAGPQAPLVDTVARGLAKTFSQDKAGREAEWNGFVESVNVECAIIDAMSEAAVDDPRQWAAKLGPDLVATQPTFISTLRDERIAWVIDGKRA